MNKKIIALGLVLVFMVTAFTACKQRYELTKINGEEYVLATDEAGNTIINEDNKIAVNPTDYNGELQTNEDGELQTYWVQLYSDVVGEDYVKGQSYKLTAPEGWEIGSLSRVTKKDTDGNCYVQFNKVADVSKEMTLDIYLNNMDDQNAAITSEFEKAGIKMTIDKGVASVVTSPVTSISCKTLTYKYVDESGAIKHYAENYYFSTANAIYKITYACENGVGYDETFSLKDFLDVNFDFKENI